VVIKLYHDCNNFAIVLLKFVEIFTKGDIQMSKPIKCFNEIAEIVNDYGLTHKDMEEVIQMLQHGFQRSIDTAIVVLEEYKAEIDK
jgi:hypothetical protein